MLGGLLLGSFLLLDIGAPKLEALLFSVTTGSFVLINIFLDDLADPFGGSWNVDVAREELEELLEKLDRLDGSYGKYGGERERGLENGLENSE